MRSEIGVGIIGCGSVARWKYVKNLAEMSGVSLRAFYGGRAEEFQQQYGAPGSAVCRDLAEFLAREDVDAVCICTPNNSHAEIALAALRARKHVLCEKPMAISAEDAVRMVETAEQMGVLLTVGHQVLSRRSGPLPPTAGRRLRLPLLCPGQHGPADGNPHLGALFRPSSPGWRMSDRSGHSRSGSGSVVAERFFPGLLLRRHLSRPGRLPYSRQPLGHLGPRHAPDGDRCLWTGCAAKRHGAESGYQLGPSRAGRPGRDRYALRHSRRGGALSRRLYNQRHTGRPLGHYPLSDAGGGAERKSGATGGFFIFHPGASAASGNSSAVFSRNADPIRTLPLRAGTSSCGILRRMQLCTKKK